VPAELTKELEPVTKEVVRFLKDQGQDSVIVGQFTGPAQLSASGGPAISLALSEQLKAQGIAIKRRSQFSVEGKYKVVDLKDPGKPDLAAIQIEGQIVNSSGDVVKKLREREPPLLTSSAAVAPLAGLTLVVPPNAGSVNTIPAEVVINPPPTSPDIKDTVVRPDRDCPYGIEVLVLENGTFVPRQPALDEGLAFIPIKRDDIYALRITNDSPYDAAVTISIDGVNVFAFSEHKEYSYAIFSAKKKGVIKGWHRTNEKSDSFLVTDYSKSAAAETLASTANVGTITATFKAAWPSDASPPPDEPPATKPDLASRAADATGRGPEVSAKYDVVSRRVGVFRAAVSVRYSK
jgi:hypothetical protein